MRNSSFVLSSTRLARGVRWQRRFRSRSDSIVPVVSDSQSVEKILEKQDMLAAAKTLAVAAEETFLTLGGVLSHIYETGAHKTLGFDGKRGFADYMLNELNIQYRKGEALCPYRMGSLSSVSDARFALQTTDGRLFRDERD